VDLSEKPAQLAFPVTLDSEPEQVASAARERLGVSPQEQAKWGGDSDRALKAWRASLRSS
jgi:hypothetical protein